MKERESKTIIIILGSKVQNLGYNVFGELRKGEIRFKSIIPPTIKDGRLYESRGSHSVKIKVPNGTYKAYITSPSFREYVNSISEMNVDEMDFSPEEIKKKEEERIKAEEDKMRAKEEKIRIEKEKERLKEEEEIRKVREAEERSQAAERIRRTEEENEKRKKNEEFKAIYKEILKQKKNE